jgi:hypothetical protein
VRSRTRSKGAELAGLAEHLIDVAGVASRSHCAATNRMVRQNFLSNRVDDNYYEAIVDACCATWNALIALPERFAQFVHPQGALQSVGWIRRLGEGPSQLGVPTADAVIRSASRDR